MSEGEVMTVLSEALWMVIIVSGPVMLVGLTVGLTISLFQTVTHLQEMTLVFIPKILAVFLALMVFLPFMIASLRDFTRGLADRIIGMG